MSGPPTPFAGDQYREVLSFAMAPQGAEGAVRLSSALRDLVRVFTGTTAPETLLQDAAVEVEAWVARLAPYAEESRFTQGERLAGATGSFLTHPIIGATNPTAPPIFVEPHAERLLGHVTYTPPYEGPRGFVHGGHIAAGFDVMVVMTAGINGVGGLSKSLAIRFRRPTPLGRPLVYEGSVESVTERSATVKVVLRRGDEVCAECTGEVAFARAAPVLGEGS